MTKLKKLCTALPTIYRYGDVDATPYMRRVVGMMIMYAILWVVISLSRFAREGWSGIHVSYLLGGEGFLLCGLLLLHLYVISRFGWTRFFRLIANSGA
jgi:hypothetical protein